MKDEILKMLSNGDTVSKRDIVRRLGISERRARECLSEIAKEYPIIAVSDKSGYRLATTSDDSDEARHAINENRKRAGEILKRNKPLAEFIRLCDGAGASSNKRNTPPRLERTSKEPRNTSEFCGHNKKQEIWQNE